MYLTATLILCFSVLGSGEHEDSTLSERAYEVLKKQDLGKVQRPFVQV